MSNSDNQRNLAALQFIALRERTPREETVLWLNYSDADTYANNCGLMKIQDPTYGKFRLLFPAPDPFEPSAITLSNYISQDERRNTFICHGCGLRLKEHE
jgi:hypothetical protein